VLCTERRGAGGHSNRPLTPILTRTDP
jgi:hypothetical protein